MCYRADNIEKYKDGLLEVDLKATTHNTYIESK